MPVKAVVGPPDEEVLRLARRLARNLRHQQDARVSAAAPVCDGLVNVEATVFVGVRK